MADYDLVLNVLVGRQLPLIFAYPPIEFDAHLAYLFHKLPWERERALRELEETTASDIRRTIGLLQFISDGVDRNNWPRNFYEVRAYLEPVTNSRYVAAQSESLIPGFITLAGLEYHARVHSDDLNLELVDTEMYRLATLIQLALRSTSAITTAIQNRSPIWHPIIWTRCRLTLSPASRFVICLRGSINLSSMHSLQIATSSRRRHSFGASARKTLKSLFAWKILGPSVMMITPIESLSSIDGTRIAFGRTIGVGIGVRSEASSASQSSPRLRLHAPTAHLRQASRRSSIIDQQSTIVLPRRQSPTLSHARFSHNIHFLVEIVPTFVLERPTAINEQTKPAEHESTPIPAIAFHR